MAVYTMTVHDQSDDPTAINTEIMFSQDATVRIIRGNLTMDVPVSTVQVGDVYMLGQGLKLVDIVGVTVED